MSVTRTWLPEYRYVPVTIKTGWFRKQVVFALEQKYHDKGDYNSPDVSGQYCPLHIDRTGWAFCESVPTKPKEVGDE